MIEDLCVGSYTNQIGSNTPSSSTLHMKAYTFIFASHCEVWNCIEYGMPNVLCHSFVKLLQDYRFTELKLLSLVK
jgi:hypothetical protein